MLERAPTTDRTAIRDHISGNYCRCTGYHSIVSAVAEVAEKRLRSARSEACDASGGVAAAGEDLGVAVHDDRG
ncbi:2Fe-2S iron-sulfur cluster-binding protein [Nocardioides sp.]|uniref:2Fe-2S iron-sulfur cluster-binding protein n=1 Tax=Nocardioides sp. TaxID=35761 RepID=UPI00351925CF